MGNRNNQLRTESNFLSVKLWKNQSQEALKIIFSWRLSEFHTKERNMILSYWHPKFTQILLSLQAVIKRVELVTHKMSCREHSPNTAIPT